MGESYDGRVAGLGVTLLLSRLAVVLIFLYHGVPKAANPAFAAQKFEAWGLPGVLGPITGVAEVVAAVLLMAGVLARPAAAVLLVVIAGALITVQIPNGIQAGLERDVMLFAALAALLTHGPGALALGRARRSAAGDDAWHTRRSPETGTGQTLT